MSHEVDKPEVRQRLMNLTNIRYIGDIPEPLFTQSAIVLGNYIGDEHGPNGNPWLDPTMMGLIGASWKISGSGHRNRLMAVARRGFKDLLPHELEDIAAAIIPADKTADDDYEIKRIHLWTMGQHVKNHGVLWMAPGATTVNDGLIHDFKTGGIRMAMEKRYHLATLAMETEGEGLHRQVVALHMAEIALPTITYDGPASKKLESLREANRAIGQYSLGVTASLLPFHQTKGEFTDPQGEMAEAIHTLHGLASVGIHAQGGFLARP